jgi:hypothetical protein
VSARRTAQSPSGAPQIGVLCPTTCSGPALDAFRRTLAELGLREGDTVTVIYREAEGQLDRLPWRANSSSERSACSSQPGERLRRSR